MLALLIALLAPPTPTLADCRRTPDVCHGLALQARDPATRKAALTRGCAAKDGRACRDLAWRLERGDGMPADAKAARIAGDQACALGDHDLCLHRLRQRQDARDWAGVRRACRRGDALSCAAHDARACRRGDAKACRRAARIPPGACPAEQAECSRTPSLPPNATRSCAQVSSCDRPRRRQRVDATRFLTQAAMDCAVDAARMHVRVSRSGDVFEARIHPEPTACLRERVLAMRLTPVASPSTVRARIITRDGRRQAHVQVTGDSGAFIMKPPSKRRGSGPSLR